MSPVPAAALLGGLAAAALLADRWESAAAIAAVLLLACLRAPAPRRRPYLAGTLGTALTVLCLTPLVEEEGTRVLWSGPTVPVLGTIDVTVEELGNGGFQAARLAAVGLAFAAYALLLDHDRLLRSLATARSLLAVALAIRLVPTLERDAAGLVEALRGRGVAVAGVRGHAALLAPLLGGSLERGQNLAEAMEARGYGRPGRTRLPSPPWSARDRLAVAAAVAIVVAGALWL